MAPDRFEESPEDTVSEPDTSDCGVKSEALPELNGLPPDSIVTDPPS